MTQVDDPAQMVHGIVRLGDRADVVIAADDALVSTPNGTFRVKAGRRIPPSLVQAYQDQGGKVEGDKPKKK